MGFFTRRRVIPGNGQQVTVTVLGPDQHGVRVAGLGVYTNTFSPAASGVHEGGVHRGFLGDPGYGVNRMAGKTPPRQNFYGASQPVAYARGKKLTQPALPNTGEDAGGLGTLGGLGGFGPQLGRWGMGTTGLGMTGVV